MAEIGTTERPLQVAIVGSGPSGFYAAAALFASGKTVRVDLIDRLPTPFGLVRGGVAPDHQNIKAVIRAYDKTAKQPGFRFLGNVCVGTDVSIDQLLECYDQVVLAVGCESANPLGVPGEDLPGSYSATDFVAWYNGHPDHRDHVFDLSHPAAVVVGVGNVAMDVTRVLVKDRSELGKTDIASHALDELRKAQVTDVHLLGRRGAAQVAFSPAEIKEIAELPDVDLVVRPEDLVLDELSSKEVETGAKTVQDNVKFLQEIAGRPVTKPKRVHLHLLTSPLELQGSAKVERVVLGRNEIAVKDGRAVAKPTGETRVLPAGAVFRAVGYRGIPVPGVPFDQRSGTIPNAGGRVTREGVVVSRLYVVGWAKRGPQGLIGTNRMDSKDTVDRMLEDLRDLDPSARTSPVCAAIDSAVTWSEWERIDAEEISRGKAQGKLREKFVRVSELLGACGKN
jgi:ferredoxin--NADP+ reductase